MTAALNFLDDARAKDRSDHRLGAELANYLCVSARTAQRLLRAAHGLTSKDAKFRYTSSLGRVPLHPTGVTPTVQSGKLCIMVIIGIARAPRVAGAKIV